MKIAVTGCTGFIGSHLVDALVKEHDVVGLAHYNHDFRLGNLQQDIELRWGDIRDEKYCLDSIFDCDVLVHLAALIDVPYSFKYPRSYIDTNIIGTHNLAMACVVQDIPMIHTSSSEVYGDYGINAMESTYQEANSPYAASKIAADNLILSYRKAMGLEALILRPFNTYGPRQSTRAFIPTMIKRLGWAGKFIQSGNLYPKRDLTYVEDTVRAYVMAIESKGWENADVLNLGTAESHSMEEVLRLLMEILGVQKEIVYNQDIMRPTGAEVPELRSLNDNAVKTIGWNPWYTLEQGLRKTCEAYTSAH